MYCTILNYSINTIDVIELPYSDLWEESKIEEYTGYNLTDCCFIITDDKPQLNFIDTEDLLEKRLMDNSSDDTRSNDNNILNF